MIISDLGITVDFLVDRAGEIWVADVSGWNLGK